MVSLKYVGNQYHWACGTAVYKTIFYITVVIKYY